jgi:hypothetical protein
MKMAIASPGATANANKMKIMPQVTKYRNGLQAGSPDLAPAGNIVRAPFVHPILAFLLQSRRCITCPDTG